MHTDERTHRQRDGHTDGQTNKPKHRQRDGCANSRHEVHSDRQTDGWTDWTGWLTVCLYVRLSVCILTERQTDRHTETQTAD